MQINGGDARFFWPENISDFAHVPSAWDASLNTGIGKSALETLWINSYLSFTTFFSRLGISWNMISLLFWILPAIIFSFVSSYILWISIFPTQKRFGILAGFIYLFNTYILMVISGGQIGVAFAYALAPLVLQRFIKLWNTSFFSNRNLKSQISNLKSSILASLTLAGQLLFDPRMVYITMGAVVLYLVFSSMYHASKQNIHNALYMLLYTFVIPLGITVLLHSFWILPIAIFGFSASQFVGGTGNVQFFSFAQFENTIALLHPNWPENIFGKIYFMRPEFLLLPILAYSSLSFLNKSKVKRTILFFALLGLLGAFLAKGTNPPFGQVYSWLFAYFPGFIMFRDPTKFYVLISISYSILLPFSIWKLYRYLEYYTKFAIFNLQFSIKSKIFNLQNLFLLTTVFYLLFLIFPAVKQLPTILLNRKVPAEYVELKDFLHSQPQFFRTLWIPQWQRFGYFSNIHPAIGRFELLREASASGQIEELKRIGMEKRLQELGVKYIIVPFDSEGELFLTDRKYDEIQRDQVIKELDRIPWLKKANYVHDLDLPVSKASHLTKIGVYEVYSFKERFRLVSNEKAHVRHTLISSYRYEVKLWDSKRGDVLVFSDSFDRNWSAYVDGSRIPSKPYTISLNSFILPKDGNYVIKVFYEPQTWVHIGLITSGLTFIFSVLFVTIRLKRKP